MSNIGGIRLHLSADLASLQADFANAKNFIKKFASEYAKFAKDISDIHIGDSIGENNNKFKAQFTIIEKAGTAVKDMAGVWKKQFSQATGYESRWARKSISNMQNVAKKMLAIQKQIADSRVEEAGHALDLAKQKVGTSSIKGGALRSDFFKPEEEKEALTALKQFKNRGIAEVEEFFKKLGHKTKIGREKYAEELGVLVKVLKTKKHSFSKELEDFRKVVNKFYASNARLVQSQKLQQAADTGEAYKRKIDTLDKLAIKEKELIKDIKVGNNVQKNRNELLQTYQDILLAGGKLKADQIASQKRVNAEVREEAKIREQVSSYFGRNKQVLDSTDKNVALKEKKAILEDLNLQENKANTQIKLGINVQENKNRVLKIYQEIQRTGKTLSRRQADEQHKLNMEIEREAALRAKPNKNQEYAEDLKDASLMATQLKKQKELKQQLRVEAANYISQMKLGVNVRGAENGFLKVSNTMLAQRIPLLEKEAVTLDKITSKRKKAASVSNYFDKNKKTFESTDRNVILKERATLVEELVLKENRLKLQIKEGINVIAAENGLLEIYNTLLAQGLPLLEAQAIVMGKINKERTVSKKTATAVSTYFTENKQVLDSTDKNKVLKDREQLVRKLRLEEGNLKTQIKEGINVQENENRILKIYQTIQKQGIGLTEKEISYQQKLTLKRKQSAEGLLHQQRGIEYQDAGDDDKAIDRRLEAVRRLDVEERKLLADKRAGVEVDDKLAINAAERLRLGKKLTLEQKKYIDDHKSTTTVDRGFLSKTWFKTRVAWFVQLRVFWGMYRQFQEGFREVKDLEKSFTALKAITMATNRELNLMTNSALKASRAVAVPISQMAEAMVKLGQAGFAAKEIATAINPIAQLALATRANLDQASDLITSLIRAWEEDATSIAYFSDILANTVNKSKVQIQGLGTALQYITGVAPRLGIELQEVAAMMGIMANRGIKMSKVGTGLRSLFGELLKPSENFKDELHKVGLNLNDIDIKSLGVIEVLKRLNESTFDVTGAFKGLDRRAASAISALINGSTDIDEFATELSKAGSVSEMATTQLESLDAKMTLASNRFIEFTKIIFDSFNPAMKAVVDGFSWVTQSANDFLKMSHPIKSFFGDLFSSATGVSIIALLIAFKKEFKTLGKILTAFGRGVRAVISWPALLATGLGVLILAFIDVVKKVELTKEAFDKQAAISEAAAEKLDLFTEAVEAYGEAIDEVDKNKILATNEDLKRIVDETKYIGDRTQKIKDYTEALKEVSEEAQKSKADLFSQQVKLLALSMGMSTDEFGNVTGKPEHKSEETKTPNFLAAYGVTQIALAAPELDMGTLGQSMYRDTEKNNIKKSKEMYNVLLSDLEDFVKKADGTITREGAIAALVKRHGVEYANFLKLLRELPDGVATEYETAFNKIISKTNDAIAVETKRQEWINESAKWGAKAIKDETGAIESIIETQREKNYILDEELNRRPELLKGLVEYYKQNQSGAEKWLKDIEAIKTTEEQMYTNLAKARKAKGVDYPFKEFHKFNKAVKDYNSATDESSKKVILHNNEILKSHKKESSMLLDMNKVKVTSNKLDKEGKKLQGELFAIASLHTKNTKEQMFRVIDNSIIKTEKEKLDLFGKGKKIDEDVLKLKTQQLQKGYMSEASLETVIRYEKIMHGHKVAQYKVALDQQVIDNKKKNDMDRLNSDAQRNYGLQVASSKVEMNAGIAAARQSRLDVIEKESKLLIKTSKLRIKQLDQYGITKNELSEIYNIYDVIYGLNKEQLDLELEVAKAAAQKLPNAEKQIEYLEKMHGIALAEIDAQDSRNRKLKEEKYIKDQISEVRRSYSEQETELKNRLDWLEIENATEAEKLELQLKIQQLAVERRLIEYGIVKSTIEERKLLTDIDKLQSDILKTEEKRKRANSIVYDWYRRVKDEMISFHEVMTQSLTEFTLGMGEGLGSVLADFTSGFQDAQQEVVNIEGQIAELNQEKDDITEDGTKTIFTEDEAKRLEEINAEMRTMNDEINDLEDPIHNIGEAFKDFFKDMIDGINEIITKWLAMQIVVGIVNAAASLFSAPSTGLESLPKGFSNLNTDLTIPRGNGGILPSLVNFKSFSTGGITNGLSFAALGDNRSGRELVIPEENVSNDHVSGYVRDQRENIYIANVVSENDIQRIMGKENSAKIFVNHVIQDMDARGPIFKRLGGK